MVASIIWDTQEVGYLGLGVLSKILSIGSIVSMKSTDTSESRKLKFKKDVS